MRQALADFQSDIARIDKVAEWLLNDPNAIAPAMIPATVAIRCGAVVLLSGYLESFIKDCMCSFISQINALGRPLHKLPLKMRYTHFENGARVLSRQVRTARRSQDTASCENFAQRLASLTGGTGYAFAWEAFAETESNPGPNVIGELLSAVGVENPWQKIKAETGTAGISPDFFLSSFIEIRNECAHSGITASPPTATDLEDYGAILYRLASAIVIVLEGRLTEVAAL